jgi:hypothetical protein
MKAGSKLTLGEAMPYLLRVGDNFHRYDSEHEHDAGEYETADQILAAARQIIDRSLAECWKAGMTAEQLYSQYSGFGEIPYILCLHVEEISPRFDPWAYAEERAKAMCPIE